MLQRIHERIKGWVAGLIIALVSVSFVLWGVEYYVSSAHGDATPVAKVNGDSISQKDWTEMTHRLERQAVAQGLPVTSEMDANLKQLALQNLISSKILVMAANAADFVVDRDSVFRAIADMPAFQDQGRFSESRLQTILYQNNLTLEALISALRNELLTTQVATGFQNSDFTLPNELQSLYSAAYQTRSFQYALVPASAFVQQARVSPEVVQHYYMAHRDQFVAPERVRIAYVVLSPRQMTPAQFAAQTDQLSNLAYTNPNTLQPIADVLHTSVLMSDWITRTGDASQNPSFRDPKLITAVFSDVVLQQRLNSDPIPLKDGSVVVLRVVSHEASKFLPLETVKDKIMPVLTHEWASGRAVLEANRFVDLLQAKKTVPVGALHWETLLRVSRTASKIPASVLEAAFKLMLSGPASLRVVTLANGDAAVVRLTAIIPAPMPAPLPVAQALSQRFQAYDGQLSYQLYVNSVQKAAKITVLPSASPT